MSPSEAFVLLVCNDLFFGTRITGAVRQPAVIVDSAATLERIGDPNCLGVMLDLNHPTAPPATIAAAAPPGLRMVAFGPHVRTDLLAAAQDAGFETITRGQLDRGPGDILRSFENRGTAD